MQRLINFVRQFHEKFGIPVNDGPHGRTEEQKKVRMKLLEEEYHEYRYAERGDDVVKIADALADMAYVIAGTALVYGIPLEAVFSEVHRSNMTKERNPDPLGKVVKGPDFRKARVDEILTRHWYGDDDV